MKKSLFSMFAVAAGLLMATSCSNELEEVKTEGEAVVSFTAQLPKSMVNRAPKALTADAATFGDGTTATNLSYAVYKVTQNDQRARETDTRATEPNRELLEQHGIGGYLPTLQAAPKNQSRHSQRTGTGATCHTTAQATKWEY